MMKEEFEKRIGFEDIRIGHEGDAMTLLDEMIEYCGETAARFEEADYFWPRLVALRDAIERGIV